MKNEDLVPESNLCLFIKGLKQPVQFKMAHPNGLKFITDISNEDGYTEDKPLPKFEEFRTTDFQNVFVNLNKLSFCRLLDDDAFGIIEANYDKDYEDRENARLASGEFTSESWSISFWLDGRDTVETITMQDEFAFDKLPPLLGRVKGYTAEDIYFFGCK